MKGKEISSDQADFSGSPMPGEPVFLVIGKLRRPHGLKGDILMEVMTDFPERIKSGELVYIGEEFKESYFRTCKWHGKLMRISFEGINDPESAGEYRNKYVYVHCDNSPELPEGEFYHHQLIGLQVISDDGKNLGVVTSILETGSNDVLSVQDMHGREILIPVIQQVMRDVNIESGIITIYVLPGLIPESSKKTS